MRLPSQSRALGALFLLLFVFFAGIAWAAVAARVWPVAVAAAALGVWIGTLAAGTLRRRRPSR